MNELTRRKTEYVCHAHMVILCPCSYFLEDSTTTFWKFSPPDSQYQVQEYPEVSENEWEVDILSFSSSDNSFRNCIFTFFSFQSSSGWCWQVKIIMHHLLQDVASNLLIILMVTCALWQVGWVTTTWDYCSIMFDCNPILDFVLRWIFLMINICRSGVSATGIYTDTNHRKCKYISDNVYKTYVILKYDRR